MSPPDTNLDSQKRRHRGPLVGMTLVVGLVLLGFVWWLGTEVDTETPAGEEVIDTAPPTAVEPETQVEPPRPDDTTAPTGTTP